MTGPRRPSRGRPDAGFMLAEALVTMAIGAFLLAALVSLVHLATRADARTGALVRQVESESRIVDALARDIGPALRVRWGGAGTSFVFAGTARALQLALRDPDTGELRLVTIEAGDVDGRVVRTSTALPPFARAPADLVPGPSEVMDAGDAAVRFAYFAPAGPGQETLTDDWTRPLEMPSAVRIALLDPATGAIRASLRVPLMIDAEPGCASPRRGVCSYVETGVADAIDSTDLPAEAVDANDPLGWMRYAR